MGFEHLFTARSVIIYIFAQFLNQWQ